MDFPEIDHCTALTSKPWQIKDPVYRGAIYIDHLLPYEQIFQEIFLKNQLCIVGPNAISNWASKKDWVLEDGSPNFNFLVENYGETSASVADCNEQEFSTHPKTEMTVKNFVLYWQQQRSKVPEDKKCLYLKDWHFYRQFPSYNAYTPPAFLCSDWMNEFWDVRKDTALKDDYRFVYMGPKNSWTPFHVDVLHSYSWSANICGQKKWIIFPPGCEGKLEDKYKQMVFDLRSEKLSDPILFPKALEAMDEAITIFQNPGEIIFIPSGWYHQVINLEDTISINHNWINGCNSHLVWAYIKNRLDAVQKEISDCRDMTDWNEHCQVILKADSGINYIEFYNFLATIANHRVKALHQFVVETLLPKFVQKIYTKDCISSIMPVCPSTDHVQCSGNDILCTLEHSSDSIHSPSSSENVISCDVIVSLPESPTDCETSAVGCVNQETSALFELNFLHFVKCDVALDSSVIVFVDHNFNQEFLSFEGGCLENSCDKENKEKLVSATSESRESTPDASHLVLDGSSKIQPHRVKDLTKEKKSESFSGSLGYLCLNSGTVVRSDSKLRDRNDDPVADLSTQPPKVLEGHQHCPHWAHCGPSLALFDIQRILDLVRDMVEQDNFQSLLTNPASVASLVVSPSELIHSIENILEHMKLI